MIDFKNLSLERLHARFLSDFNLYSFVRIVTIVGGYYFLRQILLRDIKRRQLKNQLLADEKARKEGLVDNPEDIAKATGVQASDQVWGWGKSTRQKAKRQQKIVEDLIARNAAKGQGEYDSDEDIADLLLPDSDEE